MDAIRLEKVYTIDDIYALPDEQRAELIDGQIYYMSPPSSKSKDYMTKLFKYRASGVREYWIVDPDKQMVMVYGFEKDMVEQYNFGEDMPVGIYEEFMIKVE